MSYQKNLYKDYEELLIKNDKLSEENRQLKYMQKLLESQNQTFRKNEEEFENKINSIVESKDNIIQQKDNLLKEKEYEIARLKALLNIDGTNHGIPTSQTPIHKTKVIPNTREKSGLTKGGQFGHPKHKLEKFKEEEVTEYYEHSMEKCPYCSCDVIKETGEVKEKDELDYKIVVVKRRHQYKEYICEECKGKFHQEIPNNLKEENQYGAQVQALELTLMNQANVTINKAQKITYGLTNGEINLSEGYIAKLQERGARKLKNFMEEMHKEILKQKLVQWDDTVIMINTQRACLRFYGTERIAMYKAHLHKDKEGIDEDNILTLLSEETVVEHDHNKLNYNEDYHFKNAECNRHLITDLKKVIENLGHKWAKELIELLTKTNKKREWKIKKGEEEFEQEDLNKFEDKFEKIMIEAIKENEKENPKKYYVDKEHTLINRILDYKNEYLLWVYDFNIPFTNNLSERGLRGVKSKQKASGQFWNIKSAEWYATIKTYIETCNRNNVNIYNALLMLSLGKPYTLEEILNGSAK